MIKKTLLMTSALVLAGALGARAQAAPQTFEGEVVDLACYLDDGDAGGKHQKCAKTCLTKDHVAAGLLAADGKLYALIEKHSAMKAMQKVRELGAEKVRITGSQISKGGLQAIVVRDVQKL